MATMHTSQPSLSPATPLHTKRAHSLVEGAEDPPNSFGELSDELLLHILSYLSWADLCAVQVTSHAWQRLATDNQLWRALYLAVWGRARLRGVGGPVERKDGKEVKPLPGRAVHQAAEVKDWKVLFRVSYNWSVGRCTVEDIPLPPDTNPTSQTRSPVILLLGNLTILAPNTTSPSTLALHTSSGRTHTLPITSTDLSAPSFVTSLTADVSPSSSAHTRITVSLSTGEWLTYTVDHTSPSASTRTQRYVPRASSSRTAPIVQAAYHHPLLVTLSASFHLSLYDLSSPRPHLTQTLTSFTSYPPSSLVLSAPSADAYKLVLAYTVPVYPTHWSAGATELLIRTGDLRVAQTRAARAIDIPVGFVDEAAMRAVRAQWARKVGHAADVRTDGRWVVLGAGLPQRVRHSLEDADEGEGSGAPARVAPPGTSPSTVQLYRLHFPAAPGAGLPRMAFVRSLHGASGPVRALALAEGRCVCLGENGGLWVWDLERDTGAEVQAPDYSASGRRGGDGVVGMDARRVVSVGVDGAVQVRRFDG